MGTTIPEIKSKKHSLISECASSEEFLAFVKKEGPKHIFFPQVLEENIDLWNSVIKDDPVKIFLAHKATQSSTALTTAQKKDLNIDVSSYRELKHALACGFTSENIECTGPKNNRFLTRAVELGCIISVDSINELERIIANKKSAEILIRIANPEIEGLYQRRTKFGIDYKELDKAYTLILDSNVTLKGFHVHQDGFDSETRTKVAEFLLELILSAKNKGIICDTINLGGGIKHPQFDEPKKWNTFIMQLQEASKRGDNNIFWDGKTYGIEQSEKGSVIGARRLTNLSHIKEPHVQIEEILNSVTSYGISLKQLLQECLVELWFEPGTSLLTNTGLSLFPVIEEKTIGNDNFLLCDATNFTLGTKMFEPYCDPEMIPENTQEKKEYFVTGLLCREDDVLMNRKVLLPKPEFEDNQSLIFFNTGAYRQGFEENNAQLQAQAKKFVARKEKNTWSFVEEEQQW